MDALLRDLRYAAQQLLRHRGFTAIAVLTLALGIAATTTIFSVVDAVVLRPLPFHEPGRLVRLWETNPRAGDFPVSDATYLDFAGRTHAFAEMAAFSEVRNSLVLTGACQSLAGGCEPERIQGAVVTATLFPLLGVRPALGRTFLPEEDRPGGDTHVAVVSHALWQHRFGSDPRLVGQRITLDGQRFTVTGIMPSGFDFPGAADVWIPLAPNPARDRDEHDLAVIARLQPSITLEQASADLSGIARQLGQQYPRTNAGWGVHLASLSDWIVGPQVRRAVFVLLGAVGFLLLVACVNVANLLIARGVARQAEIGIRAALGASRTRLVRQLLTESVLLAALGAAVGLGIAYWTVDALRIFGPSDIPRLDEVRIDGHVLVFTLVVGLLTSLIFGLMPAAQLSHVNLHDTLKQGARSGISRGRRSIRGALVVTEVALAMMLLVGAGLMIGSFVRLERVPSGFDAEHVLTVPLQLPEATYSDNQRAAFLHDVLTRIAGTPGVTSAGATSTNPLRQRGYSNDVTPEDRAAESPSGGFMQAGWRSVTPGFFHAMSIPLEQGRLFSAADRGDGQPVVVISETLARRLWPSEDAVGKRLFWGGTSGTPRTVIGVVGDIRDVQLDAAPPPLMFLPYDQTPVSGMTIVIKAAGDPVGIARAVRREIRAADKNLPIPELRPLSENLTAAVAGPRFRMLLLSTFAGVALLLAAVGIYGVMAFAVSQRTREIGVRVALGAHPAAVARMVVRQGMLLALAGIGAGALGAFGLTRVLESLLFGVTPTDAPTFAIVMAVLISVALVAAYLPARRAMRVDPVVALRSE